MTETDGEELAGSENNDDPDVCVLSYRNFLSGETPGEEEHRGQLMDLAHSSLLEVSLSTHPHQFVGENEGKKQSFSCFVNSSVFGARKSPPPFVCAKCET